MNDITRMIQAVTLATILTFVSMGVFTVTEPEAVQAQSASDDVVVTLNVQSEITITDGANETMTPDMGLTNDTSTGESNWTVETSSNAGYTLAVKASTTPALQSSNGDSFTDYTEAAAGTPDSWSVDPGSYEFGFSAFGDDVADGAYGSGTSCDGSGDPANTNLNYEGFTTSDNTIATNASPTPSGGTQTTICFGAGQNGVNAPSGTYTATIIATATAQ